MINYYFRSEKSGKTVAITIRTNSLMLKGAVMMNKTGGAKETHRFVIAHRANLSGPHSCLENHPASIDHAIEEGFSVEVDLRVLEDESLWLGHDGPEYEVSLEWISSRADRFWIHAKNIEALEFCVEHKFRCFSHDQDDVVLASTLHLWRFPRADIHVTKNTIIVIPEICSVDKRQYDLCTGFCTDYCWAYENSSFLDHERDIKQMKIYEDMRKRHEIKTLTLTSDRDLHKEDGRKCLALYSLFEEEHVRLGDSFWKMFRSIRKNLPQHCLYSLSEETELCTGVMHMTTMQVVSFSKFKVVSAPTLEAYEKVCSFFFVLLFFHSFFRLSK